MFARIRYMGYTTPQLQWRIGEIADILMRRDISSAEEAALEAERQRIFAELRRRSRAIQPPDILPPPPPPRIQPPPPIQQPDNVQQPGIVEQPPPQDIVEQPEQPNNRMMASGVRADGKLRPSVQSLLNSVGSEKITSLTIWRKVLPYSKVVKFLSPDVAPDKLYHTSLNINGKYNLEKDGVTIAFSKGQTKGETFNVKSVPIMTIQQLFDKTRKRMGDKDFTDYNIETLNCQNFVDNVLSAIGSNSAEAKKFTLQDTEKVIQSLGGNVAKALAKGLQQVQEAFDVVQEGGADNPLRNITNEQLYAMMSQMTAQPNGTTRYARELRAITGELLRRARARNTAPPPPPPPPDDDDDDDDEDEEEPLREPPTQFGYGGLMSRFMNRVEPELTPQTIAQTMESLPSDRRRQEYVRALVWRGYPFALVNAGIDIYNAEVEMPMESITPQIEEMNGNGLSEEPYVYNYGMPRCKIQY
jgi:hypothetical protein